MDPKKQIFFLVCGGVVLLGLIAWFAMGPDTAQAAGDADNSANALQSLVDESSKPKSTKFKSKDHVEQVKEYLEKIGEEETWLREFWKSQRLETGYKDLPKDNLAFSEFLNGERKRIADIADKAGLKLPANFKVLTYEGVGGADSQTERVARARQVAIIDEVIKTLAEKPSKQARRQLVVEASDAAQDKLETVEVGALSLDHIEVLTPKQSSDRIEAAYRAALERADRRTVGAANASPVPSLPLTVTTVSIRFTAPLKAVAHYVKALETTSRFPATVSRLDLARAAQAYPSHADERYHEAKPAVPLNTYFQEGAVRVQVELDILEYDEAKEAALKEAAAAGSKKDAKKK